MKPVWAARTGSALDGGFEAYSESTTEDAAFVQHDLAGSVAHVLGLHHVGLLPEGEATALVTGLQDLATKAHDGGFPLDPALEDVHMNIEAALAPLGDAGKRLHTGRSRNDQVATCITLYAREGLLGLASAASRLAAVLAAQAETHVATPWTAKTHGQPAQPATLGFLLAAHACRFQDHAEAVLHSWGQIGESPLGAGAVAGSTLPLDPAYTASLLGLRPLRSALLASGTRDTVQVACRTAAESGNVAAGLAQDLLDLFHAGSLMLPAGFTTGSSLMPQKRNPDALELVRGKGHALQGPIAAVTAITAPLGLGYQRDLQATKPYLVQAITDAIQTLHILADVVNGAHFPTPDAAWSPNPSIAATDVAEALVSAGIPFREAYTLVAHATQQVEDGAAWSAALSALPVADDIKQQAQAALTPDPARRATLGGPAPAAVMDTVQTLQAWETGFRASLEAAAAAAPHAYLLGTDPTILVQEASAWPS